MKCFRIVFAVLLVLATSLSAKSGRGGMKVEFDGSGLPEKSGEAHIRLLLTPYSESSTIEIFCKFDSNLSYSGETSLLFEQTGKSVVEVPLSFYVPPNDTNAMLLQLVERAHGSDYWKMQVYLKTFVSSGDTLRAVDYLPNPNGSELIVENEPSKMDQRDTYIQDTSLTNNPNVYLKNDSLGRLVIDSEATAKYSHLKREPAPYPPEPKISRDSIERYIEARRAELARLGTGKKRESGHEKMARLKREEPIATRAVQVISGDTVFIRRRGEADFSVSVPVEDPWTAAKEKRHEYNRTHPNKTYHVTLDLRSEADMKFVKEKGYKLEATERDGYFRTTVSKDALAEIEKLGIKWSPGHRYPGDKPGPVRDSCSSARP